MGSPPPHGYLFDWRTTFAAGLSLSIVDKEMLLMTSLSALTILIIAEGGAAIADSRFDNRINGPIQALAFFLGKGTSTPLGMDAG